MQAPRMVFRGEEEPAVGHVGQRSGPTREPVTGYAASVGRSPDDYRDRERRPLGPLASERLLAFARDGLAAL